MTLILLAISLTIALCVIAYNFAIYALPFMVGLTAFQYVYGMEAGFLLSALAALGAALLSVALVIAVVGFAKNPALRLIALAVFAVPAMIAGYALVHGVTKNFDDSAPVCTVGLPASCSEEWRSHRCNGQGLRSAFPRCGSRSSADTLPALARSPLSASFPSVSWRPRTPSCSPAVQFTRSHLRPTGWNNAIHPGAQ